VVASNNLWSLENIADKAIAIYEVLPPKGEKLAGVVTLSVLWVYADLLRFAVSMLKFDHTLNLRKNRIITSQAYIATRVEVGTALANQYFSCFDGLASKTFHTQPLTPAVTTI
jgi:hypothetical protein